MAGNGWDATPFVEKTNFRVTDYIALAELTPEEQQRGELSQDVKEVEGRFISVQKLTKLTSKADYDFAIYDDIDLLLRRLDKPQFFDWAGTVAKLQKERGGLALALVYQQNLPDDVLQHFFRVSRMKGTQISRHGWVPYVKDKEGITAI